MRKLFLAFAMLSLFSAVSFAQVNVKETNNSNKELLKTAPNSELSQSENNLNTTQKLPEDFPVFKDTGNKKEDRKIFHEAKQEWIKNNPERFEKIRNYNLNQSMGKSQTPKITNDEK